MKSGKNLNKKILKLIDKTDFEQGKGFRQMNNYSGLLCILIAIGFNTFMIPYITFRPFAMFCQPYKGLCEISLPQEARPSPPKAAQRKQSCYVQFLGIYKYS
jgi:hypothetical protein